MMKVWMVHAEHGEYSDWTYAVAGVFSTYEKAREYVLTQSYPVDEDGDYIHAWERDIITPVGQKVARERADGSFIMGDDGGYTPHRVRWFITEYELDRGAEVSYDYGVSVSFREDEQDD